LLELLPSTVDIISRSFGFVKGDFEISLKNFGIQSVRLDLKGGKTPYGRFSSI